MIGKVHTGDLETHSVFSVDEGIVDGHNLDVVVLDGVAEDDTTNAAETVDANLDGSHCVSLKSAAANKKEQRVSK